MKHLIAYVERWPLHVSPSTQWRWCVQERTATGFATVDGYAATALEAMEWAESNARLRGYGLDWSGGFVARGVEQDESVRRVSPEETEDAKGGTSA